MSTTAPPPQATDPAAFWDKKFADDGFLYGERPNAFLTEQAWRLSPRSEVLAVGDGEGRNGVWLAEQEHRVTSVDVSPRALQKALGLALRRRVQLKTQCADLRDWVWPVATFDAVVAVYLHLRPDIRPALHARMLQALKPGGHLILEAFHPHQLGKGSGGPPDIAMLFTAEMLREDFDAAEILHLEETATVLKEGRGHQGSAAVVRLVAPRAA